MQKLAKLLTVLISFLMFNTCAFCAGSFNVEKFGTINKIGNKLSQPINLSFVSNGAWKLMVEPIDIKIRNLDKAEKSLPITRLEVAKNTGQPLVHFEVGKSYELKRGTSVGANSMNFYINALNYNGDYPGSYIADLKFTIVQNNGSSQEEIFTFRFNQNEISSIEFDKPSVSLNVAKDKALKKNYQDHLKNPFSIYVNSNKDWKLYLLGRKQDEQKRINYYYKIVGVSDSDIKYTNCGEYIPMQDSKVMIAQGKSTLDENTNQLVKKIINMDYMVKGPEGNIIPAGTISTDFEYILESEEN